MLVACPVFQLLMSSLKVAQAELQPAFRLLCEEESAQKTVVARETRESMQR